MMCVQAFCCRVHLCQSLRWSPRLLHSCSATICPPALKAGSTTVYEWTEASCGTKVCMAELGGIDDETLKYWRAGFEACKNDTTGKHDYAVYATAMNWQLLKSIETGCGLPAGTLKAPAYSTGAMNLSFLFVFLASKSSLSFLFVFLASKSPQASILARLQRCFSVQLPSFQLFWPVRIEPS